MLKESMLSVFASCENRQILRGGAESQPFSKTKKVIMFSALSELLRVRKIQKPWFPGEEPRIKPARFAGNIFFLVLSASLVLCAATNTNLCFLCGWPFFITFFWKNKVLSKLE